MPATLKNTLKQTSRLSELWDDLLSDPVSPRPVAKEKMTTAARLEVSYPVSPLFAPALKRPSLPGNYEPDRFPHAAKPVNSSWRNSLEGLFHNLIELETAEPSPLSMERANSESEAISDLSIETAHEESLALISSFRWEPKPAWVNAPIQQKPPLPNAAVPQRSAARPKIPLRPLHKQPFYKRFFFYLRRWLSRPK
jgi:hypothetical protein